MKHSTTIAWCNTPNIHLNPQYYATWRQWHKLELYLEAYGIQINTKRAGGEEFTV